MCFQVATVVAPVVTNCSPEGFIPDEFCIAGEVHYSRKDCTFKLHNLRCLLELKLLVFCVDIGSKWYANKYLEYFE